jgi:hypothetical protein
MAEGSGGAIFSENSKLGLISSKFYNNEAAIGGAIIYNGLIPSFLYKETASVSKNTENITEEIHYKNQDIHFLNNKGKIFGHHVGSFPRELIFNVKNYDNFTKNSSLSYNIYDYQPGGALNVDISLLDEFEDLI